MRPIACLLCVLFASVPSYQSAVRPSVIPVVGSGQTAPAFLLECRNASSSSLSRNDGRWIAEYRIDGRSLSLGGNVGSSGVPSMIAVGEVWSAIFALNGHANDTSEDPNYVAMGIFLRVSTAQQLEPGRHQIAFRCFDSWSDSVAFVWPPRF